MSTIEIVWLELPGPKKGGKLRLDAAAFILDACGIDAPIELTENEYGKPSFSDRRLPRFNISHCRSRMMIGWSYDYELGVDIEDSYPIRPESLALRYFDAREYKYWASGPEDERQKSFLRLWTRKEAALKALGKGIGGAMRSFGTLAGEDAPDLAQPLLVRCEASSTLAIRSLDLDGCAAACSWMVRADGSGSPPLDASLHLRRISAAPFFA